MDDGGVDQREKWLAVVCWVKRVGCRGNYLPLTSRWAASRRTDSFQDSLTGGLWEMAVEAPTPPERVRQKSNRYREHRGRELRK